MMRLLRHLCVLAFLALSLLPRVAAADAASYDQGLLWRVEMPGRSASYVFGTLHSSESSIVRLPAPVTDAFTGARTFATEVVIDTPAMLRLSRAMLLPKGQSLDQMLTAAQLARLETVAKHTICRSGRCLASSPGLSWPYSAFRRPSRTAACRACCRSI
jgi:uncharacterized protein YbaP (TraB family)